MKELLFWSFLAGFLNGLLIWMREHMNELQQEA